MRSTRWSFLALSVAAAAACGGSDAGGVTPPPPAPPAPITRIELTTTKALMLTGSRHSVRGLVATAYDSTGAVVPNPVLTLAAPAGWAVRGDTLIAPNSEQVATVRITATRPSTASATTAARGATALAATDSATDSLQVTAGIDLTAYRWRASWWCIYKPNWVTTTDGTVIDSTYEEATFAVAYRGDSAFYWGYDTPTSDGVAQLWPTGTLVRHLHTGVVDSIPSYTYGGVTVRRQSPDTLWVYSPAWMALERNESPMPLVDSLPQRRYTGRDWCPDPYSAIARVGTTTLEAY